MSLVITKKQLVYFQLFFSIFLLQWINSVNHISGLTFVGDFINILLLIFVFRQQYGSANRTESFWKVIVVVLIFEVLFGIMQFVSNGFLKGPLLMIWSIRMFFRPFLVMYCIEDEFNLNDVNKIERLLMPMNIACVMASGFEFYVMGIQQDANGGLFGIIQGANGYLNVFYGILIIYYLVKYFTAKEKLQTVIIVYISAILVAYWAELKFLYIELALLFFICLAVCRPSTKNFLIGITFSILLVYIVPILAALLPDSYQIIFDVDALFSYTKTAYNEIAMGHISRGEGLEIVTEQMFKGNIFYILFGYGLGGANNIDFLRLSSATYMSEGWRHYNYFTLTNIYIEMGIVGLIAFGLIFLKLLQTFRSMSEPTYKAFGTVMIIFILIMMWYNQSWNVDGISYMLVLALAVPLIVRRYENEQEDVS